MNAWTRMMAGGAALALVAGTGAAAPNDPGRAKVVAAAKASPYPAVDDLLVGTY